MRGLAATRANKRGGPLNRYQYAVCTFKTYEVVSKYIMTIGSTYLSFLLLYLCHSQDNFEKVRFTGHYKSITILQPNMNNVLTI